MHSYLARLMALWVNHTSLGGANHMNKTLSSLLIVSGMMCALCARAEDMPPYTPTPGPHAGNYEATLTGTGQSTDDFDHSSFGVTGSLGYY